MISHRTELMNETKVTFGVKIYNLCSSASPKKRTLENNLMCKDFIKEIACDKKNGDGSVKDW